MSRLSYVVKMFRNFEKEEDLGKKHAKIRIGMGKKMARKSKRSIFCIDDKK